MRSAGITSRCANLTSLRMNRQTYNIVENGVFCGEPIHFSATTNSSAAGMLHSAMTCP
jgi:hypothetical protein